MALPVPGLHGAHLRSDLVAVLGRRWLSNALAHREVRVLWRGVVVESGRLLDPWTRAAAALLSAGSESRPHRGHGCGLARVPAVDTPATHILLPYGYKVRSRSGLVVHHGGFFAEDVIELAGLRMLPLDRVAADILCTCAPRDALALVDEVLRHAGDDHEVVRKQIAERLRRRQDPRGTVRGAGLLDLASARAESPAESWLRLMIIKQEFPLPEVNWPILSPDGREIYRLDLSWPGLRIALEYDGYGAHAGREVQDAARTEDLRRRGWIVVRARSEDLRDLSRVVAELRAAFIQRGYTW